MSRVVRDGRSNYKGGRDGEEEHMLSELVFAAASSYFLAFEQIGWRDWLGGAMLAVAAIYSGRLEASTHG